MIKFFLLFSLISFVNFSSLAKSYKIEELIDIAEQNSLNIKSAQYFSQAQKNTANCNYSYWWHHQFNICNINPKSNFVGKANDKK
jgi:hypothetical protein